MILFLALSLVGLGVCIVQAVLIRGYHIYLVGALHENYHLRQAVDYLTREKT